ELCAIIATALEHQRSRTNTHVGTSSADTNDAGDIRAHVSTSSASEVVRYRDAINAPSPTTKPDTSAPRPTRT
ncbi:MAG: hypothetical protein ABI867_10095, partial [Kofleriaceae bacterium]